MLEHVPDWVANQWLEVTSLLIAIAALIYAARAYNSAKSAMQAANASDLTNLRIQAKSCLVEADRSFLSLRSYCKANRASWDRFAHKHLPRLAHRPPEELAIIAGLERRGSALLHGVSQSLACVDDMNAEQLEQRIQEARTAALEIERLIGRSEEPPNHFN